MPLDGDQHKSLPTWYEQLQSEIKKTNEGKWDEVFQGVIQRRLNRNLGPEFIATRPAPGGGRVSYLEGWRAVQLANDIFGFNGWRSEVKSMEVDYIDETADHRFNVSVTATVRVTLQDGTFHEDVGCGHIENVKAKYMAFDKCRKEAVTDALKRALRKFGNALGNGIYNKDLLRQLSRMKAQTSKVVPSELIRDTDFSGGLKEYEEEMARRKDENSLRNSESEDALPAMIEQSERSSVRDAQTVPTLGPPKLQPFAEIKKDLSQSSQNSQKRGISTPLSSTSTSTNPKSATAIILDERPIVGPDDLYEYGRPDRLSEIDRSEPIMGPDDEFDNQCDDFFDDENLDEIFSTITSSPNMKTSKKGAHIASNNHKDSVILASISGETFNNTPNDKGKLLAATSNIKVLPNSGTKLSPPEPVTNLSLMPNQNQKQNQDHLNNDSNKHIPYEYDDEDYTMSVEPKEVPDNVITFYPGSMALDVQKNHEKLDANKEQYIATKYTPNGRMTVAQDRSVPLQRTENGKVVELSVESNQETPVRSTPVLGSTPSSHQRAPFPSSDGSSPLAFQPPSASRPNHLQSLRASTPTYGGSPGRMMGVPRGQGAFMKPVGAPYNSTRNNIPINQNINGARSGEVRKTPPQPDSASGPEKKQKTIV